ncbi:MAG: hypothetical protein K2W82_13130 [Candidatus Obscuribacterales bacterium]|nr:hypothetical protein [Candidatus Obscuribacterales bacterium]
MIRLIVLTAVVLTSFCLPAFAQYEKATQYLGVFELASKQRLLADTCLLENMKKLSQWLVTYKSEKGHFPEAGSEQEQAQLFLQTYLQANPYMPNSSFKIRFVDDLGLNQQNCEHWQQISAPSLKAAPGTITVITNNENLLLIWGAGADMRPLVDTKTGKYQTVIIDSDTLN